MITRCLIFSLCLLPYVLSFTWPAQAGDDWLPIPTEDITLQDDPLNPGAHAILLDREVFSDQENLYETHYARIKILTDAGRSYADISIPFLKGLERIKDLKARTVRPDGTAVPFSGEIHDQTIVKSSGMNVQAKTFALPQVEAGSIIEYRYKLKLRSLIPPTDWDIQGELSLLRGRFRVRPVSDLVWKASSLPSGTQLERQSDGSYGFDLENIPAFRREEHMPPEVLYKMRVRFFYGDALNETDEEYWRRSAKSQYELEEEFIGRHKDIQKEIENLLGSQDSEETKLRKLYARAQQIRNLTFENRGTSKEEERQKIEENKNVKDVLRRNYGNAWEVNRLFVAFARAAGFRAAPVMIVTRDDGPFVPAFRDWRQFNDLIVWIRLPASEIYLDPGNPYTPFAWLNWVQAGVIGIRLSEQHGEFVQTPLLRSGHALLERRGRFHLDEGGMLTGKMTVSFHGVRGMQHRVHGASLDAGARLRQIESQIRGWLPADARIDIKSILAWDENDQPLRVECSIVVPDFAASTGRHLVLPLAAFQIAERIVFKSGERLYPIHFRNPWEEIDEIVLEVPEDYRLVEAPHEQTVQRHFGEYHISCQRVQTGLSIVRQLVVASNSFQAKDYAGLVDFFNQVKAGDEQHAVLEYFTPDGGE